jgi:hypothetical protein
LSALVGGEACGAFFDPPQLPNAGKMARTQRGKFRLEHYGRSLLKRQMTDLIKAAHPEPLDRDLARGVRGREPIA